MKKSNKVLIKRILISIVIVIILPFLMFGILLLSVPISRSDESVCKYVLKQIPIGTSWNDSVRIIESNEWKIKENNMECGLIIYSSGYACYATEEAIYFSQNKAQSTSQVVGEKVMFIELGEYYGPFHTAVFAYLAFDEDDKLIEIAIRRDIDSF